jgi:hypothetical protein
VLYASFVSRVERRYQAAT